MVAFIALGSNLGDRQANLTAGLAGLNRRGLGIEARSSVWETEPVGAPEPLWFLNMVVRAACGRSAEQLLGLLLEVEKEVGRTRSVRNAPRVLDLDLLLAGNASVSSPRLILPHPRMWARRFVLEPLAEIAPDLTNPQTGLTAAETCLALRGGPEVRRIGPLAAPRDVPV